MCPRTKKRPWSQRGWGDRPFMGKSGGPGYPLVTSRAKGSREEGLGGERWKGGSLRKDSKFRQEVGAAKYKGVRSKDRLTLL